MLLIDVERKVVIKKDASEKHATAGLSLVKLSNSAFLICGGANKEIFVFTSLMPAADPCDLNDKCIINTTGVTFPIPWLKCDGICKRWIYQACSGLTVIPKVNIFARTLNEAGEVQDTVFLCGIFSLVIIITIPFAT